MRQKGDGAGEDQYLPVSAVRVTGDQHRAMDEKLAVEMPFELRINGRSQVLLMTSRGDPRELAVGYCHSEGLVQSLDQILAMEAGRGELPELGPAVWLDVTLPPDLARRAKVRRSAPAATSCGLCGLTALDQLASGVQPVPGPGPRVPMAMIHELFAAMEQSQPLFKQTGGSHAICLATAQGEVLAVREDVGRHNALDRSIGAAKLAGRDLTGCLGLLSGRVSYEMALKAARVGLGLLASISAPTALGQRLCHDLNITLVGFCRHPRATVYTHPGRVLVNGAPLPRD